MQPTLIVINSAIAGGKSELIRVIKENLPEISGRKVVFIDERLDLVTNINGDNLLEKFYKDMGRWAFTLQFFFMTVRVEYVQEIIKTHGNDAIYIMERDWFADKKCFAETLHENGKMSESEWYAYLHLFNRQISTPDVPKITAYVFIDCSLETHMKRLLLRGRKEETDITSDYELSLIKKHREIETDYKSRGIPLLSINGEQNFKDSGEEQKNVLKEIEDFVTSII